MCPTSNWPLRITSGGPNPWAPLAFTSRTAPIHYPLTLQTFLITIVLVLPLNASPYYIWWFYLQESWTDGPTTKTHYLAQADCQPAGCQSAVRFKFPISWNNFVLCFLYDQTEDFCHWWNTTYGGCPYASCVKHTTFKPVNIPKILLSASEHQGMVSLTTHDPWDGRWEKGTTGKIYTWVTDSCPSGTWLIFRSYTCVVPVEIDQLNSLGNTILQNEATLTNQLKSSSNTPQPFSWLTLVQQGANMLNLAKATNFTNCFLCASLSNPSLSRSSPPDRIQPVTNAHRT
nr:putative endogenous retrovirus group FC1 Env polyprotein [Aotus nancymaae]XP_012317713.1 putative endogenous retrovirus group FC1 Env polyprotein [Aotus nancymaae]XP_012317714.1 putative endogenous retrovirus group FC1 Env polyprotein [Aotus nancymaae]